MTSEGSDGNDSAPAAGNILNHSLNKEMKTSYINYAMSVIIGRALPDVEMASSRSIAVSSMECMREAIPLRRSTANLPDPSEK